MPEEPPYGIILNGLRTGRVVPFLGAAASKVNGNGAAVQPPSGADLAEALARLSRLPSTDPRDRRDLARVSSFYVDVSSRDLLRSELRRVFVNDQYCCNDLHRLLARIADRMVIVTTNYDTLLEQAFREAGKEYDLVVYPADNDEYANGMLWWEHGKQEPQKLKANEIDIDEIGKRNLIYKMHGSVSPLSSDWDGFVITEEDYIKFLARIRNAVPSAFRAFFKDHFFLFLGYGLQDWNFRVLLKEVSGAGNTSWAILKSPSLLDQALWSQRKVKLYDLLLEDFVTELKKELEH
jgi:hypothetical protein